ncbi:hypothetical protein JCM10450v2_002525 [Rhodotorula kratochvilovae]
MGADPLLHAAAPPARAAPRRAQPRRSVTPPSSSAESDEDDHDDDDDEKAGEKAVPPTDFQRFRYLLRRVLSSPRTEWTIIAFSVLDFVLCFVQITWLILRDPECECRGTCDEEEPHWLHWLDIASLIITGAFVFEIPLDLTAFGPRYYTSMRYHWLHLVDSLVILVAFVLEIVLEGIAGELASLVTILRLWRVVKLVSTAEIGMVDYNELTMHEEERAMWARERDRMRGVVEGLRRRLGRYEGGGSEKGGVRSGGRGGGRKSSETHSGSESA